MERKAPTENSWGPWNPLSYGDLVPDDMKNTVTPYRSLTASLPLKNGGTGRPSGFLLGPFGTFQGLLLLNFGRV